MTEWRVNNCPKCGGPLKSMSEDIKFCPYCGVELEKVIPEGKFTLNINKKIDKEIRNVTRDETEIEKGKIELQKLKWIIILIAIYLFCLLIIGFFG